MKKKMILAMAMMISLGVNAQKKWTLDDCISYALENNITLLQAKLRKQSATEDRKQSHYSPPYRHRQTRVWASVPGHRQAP